MSMCIFSSTPDSKLRRRTKQKTVAETKKLSVGSYNLLYSSSRKALEEPNTKAKVIDNEGRCTKQSNRFHKGKTVIFLGTLSAWLFGLAFQGFLFLLDGKPTYVASADFVDTSLNSSGLPHSISDNLIKPRKLDILSSSQILMHETIQEIYERVNRGITRSAFNNKNSPQHKAKTWIMYDDKHFDGIDSINPKAIVQRYILTLFYFAMDGENWKNNKGWLSRNNMGAKLGIIENMSEETSECLWHGITCVSGTVVDIWLEGNGLNGYIPTELGLLPYLDTMAMYSNFISGVLPLSLLKIERLRQIDVHDNNLSGTIPYQLYALEHLEFLGLQGNNFSGTISSRIENLQKLKTLYLHENNFVGSIPHNLGALRSIRRIALESNNLTGEIPSTLGNLVSLTWFSAHHNNLSGKIPSVLQNLKSLERLYLNHNSLSGSIGKDICNLVYHDSLIDFHADCIEQSQKILCTCCTVCCSSTECIRPNLEIQSSSAYQYM